MQIVIEIDEEIYKGLFDTREITGGECAWLLSAVQNGTPLPKNHGDLIDRDELELDTEWDAYYDAYCSYSQMQINNAPTIIGEVKANDE